MSWVKVLPQEELPKESRKVVKVGNRAILLLHHGEQIYAIENNCPHMKLPMQGGKITDDNAIVCPWHRSAFDLQSGNVKEWSPWPPGVGRFLGMVSKEKALAVFSTRLEEDSIWIDVNE